MAQILRCCPVQSINQPYIGVDEKCNEGAIFCIEHNPHKNTQGLMHQMLPLKHFKKTLMQKKFRMGQKIGVLIDQYNNLMDSLIEQILQLKLRKNIQLSMLWLRQLAKDQEEYQLMRQIYRMDFKDLTCSLVHSIYFKIVHNQILEKKSVKQIDCYKGISQILQHLSQQKQTRSFLSKKIAQIQGILQNGQILKRALPDKMVYKENIKQVLLESPHADLMDIKYNKCKLIKGSRQYVSIFSKYPIVPHVLYHLNFQTKYTNVMLGICAQSLTLKSTGSDLRDQGSQFNESYRQSEGTIMTEFDKHYSKDSIIFNCTNGCVYKDGMFESGSSALTKGQKQLILKMRVTSTNELLIMLGKNILCRQKIDDLLTRNQGNNTKLYLHVLLRTEGDSFDVDRDKDVSSDQLSAKVFTFNNLTEKQMQKQQQINPKQKINFEELKKRNEEEPINVNNLMEGILLQKDKDNQIIDKGSYQSLQLNFNQLNSANQFSRINQSSTSLLDKQFNQGKQKDKNVVKKIENIQQKKSHGQNLRIPLNMEKQDPKEAMINEIIKKQRIDKILNDIKSKPMANFNTTNENSVVAKKLKEIQQRKSSNLISKLNVNDRLNSARNKIQQHSSNSSNRLKPTPSQNIVIMDLSHSSYQTSQHNINSPLIGSSDIQPLLMMQKPEINIQVKKQNDKKIVQPEGVKFSTQKVSLNKEEPKTIQKPHPSQKIFNFGQSDSSDFQHSISEQSFYPNLRAGGFTPVDRINKFQFGKKNVDLKQSFKNKETYQRQDYKLNLLDKKGFHLHNSSESDENLGHSGAFYNNNSLESSIIDSSYADQYSRNFSPKIRINEDKKFSLLPPVNQSTFSKVTSNSNLVNSNLESSFGGHGIRGSSNKINDEEKIGLSNNAKKRMTLIDSIINLGSGVKNDSQQEESIHIGHIISPQKSRNDQQDSSIVQQSYDMDQFEQKPRESVINIRQSGL